MNKWEEDMIEQLRKKSEDIQIPDSLRPDQIEKRLSERPKKYHWKKGYTAGLAAACCLLVCGAVWGIQKNPQRVSPVEKQDTATDQAESSDIQTAKSYDQIYEYLQANQDNQYGTDTGMLERGVVTESAEDSSSTNSAAAADTGVAQNSKSSENAVYSETNVRQEGVDEADVVKTDGRYLYTLKDNGRSVAIVDTSNGELQMVISIPVEDDDQAREFYVNDGHLILVSEFNQEREDGTWTYASTDTRVTTYDITDPEKPEKAGEVTQSGSYTSSRLTDGHLYLFTQYSVDVTSGITPKDKKDYIPYVNQQMLEADDIYLPPFSQAYMYEVVSLVDVAKPGEIQDTKAIFSDGGELYVSNDNIYWYETQWSDKTETVIKRISYKGGKLKAEASGKVDGYINDSFSIDEYDGYLRVVTTDDETNGLYILDSNMKEVGSITGLAEGEQVYSARLLGDTGYFVTYEQTDPLFSVDLSDPKNPKIIGKLKIPGFSEYLHFYGENLLLGIGMDVDEDGFTTNGVKLSMFDISDSSDVKEIQKYTLENVYSAAVMYDYKAVLIDPEKNVIGFAADGNNGENYYVFSYNDTNGFDCLMNETVNGNGYQSARGVYVDNTLYVVKGNIIEAYDMADYQKIDDLIL
mgnify:FL=1